MKTNSNSAGLAVHTRAITNPRQLIFRRAWLWTGCLAFATFAFAPRPAQAAVTEAWVQRYSNVQSNAAAQAIKVVRDAAGDIIVTGSTGALRPEIQTVKYSGADGSVLWQQRYNYPRRADTRPSALAVDGSGNVVVTGNSDVGAIATVLLGYTAKYAAADGALLWEKHGNRTANRTDSVQAVAVDDSGNVVVTGSSLGSEPYTAKYAAADGTLLWERRGAFGGGSAVAVDGSGNVVVVGGYSFNGTTIDYYNTAKYAAADGALLWEKRSNQPANSQDFPNALAVDGGGNVVVAGYSFNGTNSTGFTAKYAAADGALVWEKRNIGRYKHSYVNAVAMDPSGNVIIAGNSGGDLESESYTVKYAAAAGELLWEKHNNKGGGTAMAVDDSGNVVVTGSSYNGANGDYYTAKYAAADGALLWEQSYNGPANKDDSANAVVVDGIGNVVVTGATDVNPAFEWTSGDYYTAKYAAADGALLWEQSYDSAPYDASPQAVAVDGSGNVVVTGSAASHIDSSFISVNDYYTAKYAAAHGALLWEKRYNGPPNGDDVPTALAVDGSGNVVVTGYSHNGTNSDYYTAKYAAADGVLLWEKRYNGPANGSDFPAALAVGSSGDVVVTGSSYDANNFDHYTAKYAAADGALLWEKRYNGPANTDDVAKVMALDGSGNVVVTGYSYNGTNSHYYTAKYAAADGALVWEKRSNRGEPIAMAVDGSGNIVVTGSSFYTAKYAAADGALLWEQLYNGSGNDSAGAAAVAVDGNGNVVVTGTSSRVVDSFGTWTSDYYTAKYASTDGALLWEKRYNGPPNGYDEATGVAVDDSGNVVVTGTSASFGSLSDYYTVKYAAADGALLWEKRFTGSASSGVTSHCLALGPDGMVAVAGTANGGLATVVYREVPEVVSINLASTGVRLRFSGISGRTYNIGRAPAVAGPWSIINTQVAPGSGLFEYLDTNPPASAAFYRMNEP